MYNAAHQSCPACLLRITRRPSAAAHPCIVAYLYLCRESWTPLAEPVEVFSFDFTDVAPYMAPAEAALQLRFTSAGVFNAVAMWFELQLDEETTLRCMAGMGMPGGWLCGWVEGWEVWLNPGGRCVGRPAHYLAALAPVRQDTGPQ